MAATTASPRKRSTGTDPAAPTKTPAKAAAKAPAKKAPATAAPAADAPHRGPLPGTRRRPQQLKTLEDFQQAQAVLYADELEAAKKAIEPIREKIAAMMADVTKRTEAIKDPKVRAIVADWLVEDTSRLWRDIADVRHAALNVPKANGQLMSFTEVGELLGIVRSTAQSLRTGLTTWDRQKQANGGVEKRHRRFKA